MPTQLVSLQDLSTGGQLALPFHHSPPACTISITPEIEDMLASACAVAIGVSGGKDSQACALRLTQYLNEVGHTGPRVLVHADLGSVEWEDSLPACERLADHLNLELFVVRRKAGGMMTRWRQRWQNNVLRYQELSCVRLIVGLNNLCSPLRAAIIASLGVLQQMADEQSWSHVVEVGSFPPRCEANNLGH